MPRRRTPLLVLALVAGALAPALAHAVCNVSACDATGVAACCTASTCTIDGTLTVTGPTCSFDFGARNLVVSGQVAAQGKTITLTAKSVTLTGLIDVRGPNGGAAGNVTIVTTGKTAIAFSQQGGTSAIINASSTNGAGGNVTIQADGMVSFAKGSVTADGHGTGTGGAIDVETTAGDVSVQIPITASSDLTAPVPNGSITIATPGNLNVGGSGRLQSDLGTIDLDASSGAATFADGSVVQANNGGGSITLVAGSITGFGEFRADSDDGSIELHAVSGPMTLSRLSSGITLGPGFQSLALETDASGPDGLLTMDMPILANGADVELDSEGGIIVSKKIETTGILDSGAGDITLDAVDDVDVSKAIVGADVYDEADLEIDGRDITIEGNLDLRGGLDTPGGTVEISADRDLVFKGDIFVNVSGADDSDAGSMDFEAGRNITVASTVELDGSGSPTGAGATITILAGEAFAEHLPGDVLFQGDINANGHLTAAFAGGSLLVIQGCNVTVPAGAILDVTGDANGSNHLIARKSLTVGGQLKATGANVLEFAAGAAVSLTGSFTPARSAGVCANGTVTPNGCQRAVCTGVNQPAGCLYACPTCGDDVVTFPETCEIGGGGAFCDGSDLCDVRCREHTCTTSNSCATASCDAQTATCTSAPKPDATPCDNDDNICTGVGTCTDGICRLTPGTVLQCNDGNPCTGNAQAGGVDTCDPVTGCNHTPLDGPRPGCTDNNFCNGQETCVSGTCESGPLPCTPPNVCNVATQQCEGPPPCTTVADCVDDGNPCTQTVCSAQHQCVQQPEPAGTSCDDGNRCNGVRTCDANGICQQPGPPVDCDDHDLCTGDSCDPQTGACSHTGTTGCCTTAAQCNDGNACTVDSCDASSNTCVHTALTCTSNDACMAASCNPQSGCFTTPIPNCQLCADASSCSDDADVCTDKACVGGRCLQVPNPDCCNTNADCLDIDRNPCTDNGTCVNHRCGPTTPLTGTACGTTCNPATCQSGTCVADPPKDCSDNNPCTTDLCTDDQGCVHTHIAQCCFTNGDCNDQNACTTDTCDLDRNGCNNVAQDQTCVPCSGNDPFECGPRCSNTCQSGRCASVGPACVTDDNPCTVCDPQTGCKALDGVSAPGCDDGQACNGAEQCVAGECKSPGAPECDDGDACTDDGCTDPGGCTHTDKGSYDGIRCRLDGIAGDFTNAAADQVNGKTKTKSLARLAAIRKKLDKAQALTKCKRQKNLVNAVGKQLRALQKSVNKSAGKKIDATLATDIAGLAGDAAAKADAVRDGLGC